MTQKILLVGGGLSGSLMAIFLAKRGFDVHLFERRPDMRKGGVAAGRSINLALSARGINALEKVGLADRVLHDAIPMNGRMMHDLQGNLTYQPYGTEGQYINSVSRGGLNIRLLELADEFENIHIYFNHVCIKADLESATAEFETDNGQILKAKGDYMIGTDGAYSAVRDAFQRGQRFNYSQSYIDHGYKELHIPDVKGDFAMDKNCLHIWPRGSFMMIALPNPDASFTCTLFFPYDGENGFNSLNTRNEVESFFKEKFSDAIPLMPTYLDDFQKNPVGSLVTVRSYPWVKGKSVLLGDAAHAVVPFFGQGMNCSFEDCVVLDECLEKFLPDWDKALDEYQKLRKVNADAIADLALQNFVEMRDLVGDQKFIHRKHVEHDLCEKYSSRFKSQYELVTFSNLPYAKALAQGVNNNAILDYIIDNKLENSLDDKDLMNKILTDFGF